MISHNFINEDSEIIEERNIDFQIKKPPLP